MRRLVILAFVMTVTAFLAGCVGPNKLKRGLDRHLNQSYVNSPLKSQLMFPVNIVANHIAILGDLLFLNPKYFWTEVFTGEGSPYVYEQVEANDSE